VFWAKLFSRPRKFELNLAFLPNNSSILYFLLDIEGTTSSVDFVYKTLFPYASAHAEAYLREHAAEAPVRSLIEGLQAERRREAEKDPRLEVWRGGSAENEIASAARYLRRLIELDRKVTPLKTLQGKIWEEGFRNGELLGHVYEDVPRAFKRWKKDGKRIGIFSSGSVLAQKLLFGHSNAGDLTAYIDDYFDTTTGPKREVASYEAIAKTLGIPPEETLFVSDVAEELDAARSAGMHTALMLRPGTARPDGSKHACVESFDDIHLEA
jgi:enolase-phosphatase E1